MKFYKMCFWLSLLIISTIPSFVFAFSGSGSGTIGAPYQITTCAQFVEINDDRSAYYTLQNDIDCTSTPFTNAIITSDFTGNFNGQMFSISGISITSSSGNNKAIFRSMSGSAFIGNLIVLGATINSAGPSTGMLLGTASDGEISNVSLSGTVTGSSYAGSLIGFTSGAVEIRRCTSSATVSGPSYIGGLVGGISNGTIITDSYFSGIVNTTSYGGGIIGGAFNDTSANSIENCYVSGSVDATSYCGGIAGLVDQTTISNSFVSGQLSGPLGGAAVGLLSTGTLSGVYFDVTATGRSVCGAPSGCTAVNVDGLSPNYFLGNSTNAPMSSWNFSTVWLTFTGLTPFIQGFPTPTPTVTPTPTNTATVIPTNTPTITPTVTPIGIVSNKVPSPEIIIDKSKKVSLRIRKAEQKQKQKYFAYILLEQSRKIYLFRKYNLTKGTGKILVGKMPKNKYRAITSMRRTGAKTRISKPKIFTIK